MFAYCGNNPVNGFDPSGHFFIELLNELLDHAMELCSVDGPAPVGEAIAATGIVVLGGLSILEWGFLRLTASNPLDGITSATVVPEQLTNPTTRTALGETASKNGLYECKEAAIAMCKQDKGSSIIMLKFPGGGFVVADECRFGNQAISRNGQHYGYKDSEGFVHCNVYPFGLPYEVWVNSFHDLTGQPPIVIEIPIFY